MRNIGGNRERRGSYDYWGCRADYDHELDGEAEKRAHDEGECQGLPYCDYCLDDQRRAEEALGG